MNKVQSIQLQILKEIDRICKVNEIQYFIEAGTALGAFRHQGFIPWDDDIDIAMMREDYNKFLAIAPAQLGKKFFLQTLSSDPGCPVLFAKVRMNGTTFIEENKNGMKMHTGIWVDIFPMDFASSNTNENAKIKARFNFWTHLFALKKIPHKLRHKDHSFLKHYFLYGIRKIIHLCLLVVPDKVFTESINKLVEKTNASGKDRKFICSFIDNAPILEYSKIFPLTTICFEDAFFPSVRDIDYYLTMWFGNYMQLPPEEERVGHKPLFLKTE